MNLPKPILCECDCHGHGVGHPCSIEGGCGHLHPAHRCVRGARCIDRESVASATGQHWRGALLTEPGLCVGCHARVASAIRELPPDVLRLNGLIAAGTAPEGEHVGGTRELSVVIRLGIDALRTEIDATLSFWAYHLSEKLAGWSVIDAAHTRQLPRVQKAAAYVANRLDTLVTLPIKAHPCWDPDGARILGKVCTDTGMDGALHLLELHHRAYRVAGRTRLVHRLTPACPWCDHPTLVRDNGSDKVHCENPACRNPDGSRREIEERHYDWFADQIIKEETRVREARK